jgi:ribosome-associated heat shock protein Hsp15
MPMRLFGRSAHGNAAIRVAPARSDGNHTLAFDGKTAYPSHPMRIDQWLWAVRVFKTRSLANAAIRGGHVKIGEETVKPARDARSGDVIVARVNQMTRTVRVIGIPESRVGAKLVPQFAEDLTPAEEYQRRREVNLLPPGFRARGTGRPTKLERRDMEKFTGG